jgi:hypothetical protein
LQPKRIALAGNSFGGVQAVLGVANAPYPFYCAAVDASGGAESWKLAPELQALMKTAVRASKAPVFFLQAENDFDLSPSRELLAEMKLAGKEGEAKIYPPLWAFGAGRAQLRVPGRTYMVPGRAGVRRATLRTVTLATPITLYGAAGSGSIAVEAALALPGLLYAPIEGATSRRRS